MIIKNLNKVEKNGISSWAQGGVDVINRRVETGVALISSQAFLKKHKRSVRLQKHQTNAEKETEKKRSYFQT